MKLRTPRLRPRPARPAVAARLREDAARATARPLRRWAWAGAALGALAAAVAFLPATWLAGQVAGWTGQRVLLAQASGTVWSGEATLVLTGGRDSRDATMLPGRLRWRVRPALAGWRLELQQDCCLNGTVALRISPGIARTEVELLPKPGWLGQWPSALLSGLGTPWNTLQLGGAIQLSSPGLRLVQAAGRWSVEGRAEVLMLNATSPLVTLEQLGSYRLALFSTPEGRVQTTLETTEGPLQLQGEGTLGPAGLHFRGEAWAAPGEESALNNLLNIIGRRQGERSLISIG